jgi:hypothetical protein
MTAMEKHIDEKFSIRCAVPKTTQAPNIREFFDGTRWNLIFVEVALPVLRTGDRISIGFGNFHTDFGCHRVRR